MTFNYKGIYNRCGFKDYKFSLLKCEDCDFYGTWPKPTNEVYPQSRDESKAFIEIDTSPWNNRLLKKIKKHKESGKLLEIGCNSGDFINMAKDNGYEVFGIEIDEVAAKQGISKGRNMIHGDFLKMNITEKYDIIVANHVLEHIPEIELIPKALKEVLAPNGVVIINVPNIDGNIVKIMKQNWCQMAPFTHIWFFTKKSMHKLFRKDFESIQLTTNTHCEPDGLFPLSIKTIVKYIIIHLSNLIGMGDELSLVAKSPKP
tara:strand:- start:1156 stop:1932 length:777 start_codon:yes stop_codon:yes gene_type:complete